MIPGSLDDPLNSVVMSDSNISISDFLSDCETNSLSKIHWLDESQLQECDEIDLLEDDILMAIPNLFESSDVPEPIDPEYLRQAQTTPVSRLNIIQIPSDTDDEDDHSNLFAWTNKLVTNWSEFDTIQWLLHVGGKLGQSYGGMSRELAMPGEKLIALSRENFIAHDPNFGAELFDLLHHKEKSKSELPSLSALKLSPEKETGLNKSNCPDGEGTDVSEPIDPEYPRQAQTTPVSRLNLIQIPSDTDDDHHNFDPVAWMNKSVTDWSELDTIQWLLHVGRKLGQSYGGMSRELAMPGEKLIALSRENFIAHDPNFGAKLFDLLHHKEKSKSKMPSLGGSTGGSKGRKGRPPNPNRKKKEPQMTLPFFLMALLRNPNTCPRIIRWENYSKKLFRFVQPKEVSRLWGIRERKQVKNKGMNYEKLSRAMRYHYKKGNLESVGGRRLVYKFGKNAPKFESHFFDDFDPDYCDAVFKEEQ